MAVAKVCRVCMCKLSNMTESFESFSQEIISKIEFCTGVLIQKEDCFPSQICMKCLADLHIAHKFKINCINSEKAFQESVKCSNGRIKTEVQMEKNHEFIKLESYADNERSNDEDNSEDVIISDCGKNYDKGNTKDAVENTELRLKKENEVRAIVSSKSNKKCRKGLRKFRRLYCEPCQMAFNNRKESVEHKKRFHKEQKGWICEICGKSYVHRSSQIAHMHSHFPARYSCHHCDYSTHNKNDLVKHVRTHTGDKLFKCTQCSAAYRTSSNLRTHVRLFHERMRAHACHVCGKTYNDRATLNRHIDAHNDIKRHVCEVCHSCFSRRCYWKKHLQKQHDIIIPSCRPGRPKATVLLLERSEKVT